MTFPECVQHCATTPALMTEFDRLTGCNLSMKGQPIELMVDKATGRLENDALRFIEFVYECVWLTLVEEGDQP